MCVCEREEREDKVLLLKKINVFFSPKQEESCRELAFEATQWRMAAVKQASQQNSD